MRFWLLVLLAVVAWLLLSRLDVRAQESDEDWQPRREYVRLTFYTLRGTMASGQYTRLGAAACSYGFPMGSVLMLPDGWEVTCLDRGLLGRGTGWVDVWAPSLAWGRQYVTGDYGDYAWVSVLRWGWGSSFIRL